MSELINEEIEAIEEVNTKKARHKSRLRELLELVIIFLIMLFIFNFIIMSVKVNGTSMEPNYRDGERGIMLRTNPLNKPDYDDVVVIKFIDEYDQEELIVKRVFAMPNDTIEIENNKIYVNGEEVADPHQAEGTVMDNLSETQLAADEIFVLGDNRNVSLDSRIIGPIKLKDVKAVNGLMFWPLDSFGLMK
ncbi:signal peptidase I [Erysipelotrichaceae bacterium OttesenSCG-928-M19]|nr:signal peptidase I [Erysipelotrichaceae bacterium OttesenSCG-928-M19]